MLAEIIGAVVIIFGIIGLLYKLEGQGRKAAQSDHTKQVLDDIHTATMARDQLRHDADAAKRVRERFTR